MNRTRVSLLLFSSASVAFAAAGSALVGGCTSAPTAKAERICTPDAYVFCHCQEKEGTKHCRKSGDSFEPCECAEPGKKKPPLTPGDKDAGFEPVDAAVPQDGGITIDARCSGKLAVLASGEDDIFLYAAAYTGKGTWSVARSQGPALRSPPRGALVQNALVAVWRTRFDLVAWTKFESNQTTLSPPVSVGVATTTSPPAIVGSPTSGTLYYRADEDAHKEGAYSPATAWDEADTLVPAEATAITGKSGPAAAITLSGKVIAFAAADGTLATRRFAAGIWDPPVPIAGAQPIPQPPALAALTDASEDALLVYLGADLLLHSSSRAAADQTWSAPILVDTAASPDGVPALATMGKGRAMLVWRATSGAPFYSVYDAGKSPRWTTPATLLSKGNPTVIKPPTVVPGRCASEATAAYVAANGNVYIALFADGAWTSFAVPGMEKMTFAGAGEVP